MICTSASLVGRAMDSDSVSHSSLQGNLRFLLRGRFAWKRWSALIVMSPGRHGFGKRVLKVAFDE